MILLINICKEKLHFHEFVKPIEDILRNNNLNYEVKHYNDTGKDDFNKADKVIICGTSLKDNEFLKNKKKFEWLKTFKKPVLGICGGAHLIGLTLGYKLKKKKEIGLKELILRHDFLGTEGMKQVYYLHSFHALPETFHEKNLYATLFHPEVRNKEMILNFSEL